MKKLLLTAAVVAMAAAANAQIEVGFLNAEALGLDNKPACGDMFKLAETENVTMYMAFAQGELSKQNPDFQGMKTLVVNGQEIALVPGVGGKENGKCTLSGGPQAGGCIYQLDVKKDGWMIVPSKISSNKNFYAYLGLVGADPSPVAYTLGMDLQNVDYPTISEIKYSLPAGEYGILDMESPELEKYTLGADAINWPIRIATQNPDAATAGNGTGALVFPVYAEAENYLVFATGSKMNTCGFVFVESDPAGAAPNVAVKGEVGEEGAKTEKVVVITGEYTGSVSAIDAAFDENAPVYNAQGMRVNADAKGLLIQNGKKFIRK